MDASVGSFGIALAGGSSTRSTYSHANILSCNHFGMAGSPYPTGTSSETLFARDARTAGGDLMQAPIQNDNIRCCEILLRPFVEQTHFILNYGHKKIISPQGVKTFDHALYNLPSVGVFPCGIAQRLIYTVKK